MRIEWVGHSCFKVTLTDGRNILFDPYADAIGYSRKTITASVVLVSHDHYDHRSLDHIEGKYVLIDKPGSYEVEDIKITGILTYHDKTQGKERGENVVFIVEAEGIRIMHMGDIGYVPDDDFFENAGKIDILMLPVGGVYTIDAEEALEICKRMDPNIILPMHYKTMFLQLDVDPIFKFTDAAGRYFDRSRLGNSSFEISADNLKKRSRIIVMDHSIDNLD